MTTKPIAELIEAAKRGAEFDFRNIEYYGCLWGDCHHNKQLECYEAVAKEQHAQDKARFDVMADLLGKALHALNRIEWMNDDTDEGIISRTALAEIQSGLEKLAVRG